MTDAPRLATPPGPFMKWAGGKARLISQLDPLFPAHVGGYLEPFVGGGAVFFHLYNAGRFDRAVVADYNPDVVNVWRTIRDDPDTLTALLQIHERRYLRADAGGRACYFYEVRGRHPVDHPEMGAAERAARMLFLNRTCFNGLWRENASGRFNAPHGRYPTPHIAQDERIAVDTLALRDVVIAQADFRRVPDLVRAHDVDFVYLDPPYHPVSATSSFNAYSGGQFSSRDQADLAAICHDLDAAGVRFVLSNSDCPLIRALYAGFEIVTVSAPRAVSARATSRGNVTEVAVRNRRPGLAW